MIRGHGGGIHQLARRLGCQPGDIADMSSNVNPLGPMPELMAHLRRHLDDIQALPEVDAATMTAAFARICGLSPDQVLAGNGSTEIIYLLPRVLAPTRAVVLGPTYADYADACRLAAVPVHHVAARAEDDFAPPIERLAADLRDDDLVFVCNPNNPTGALVGVDRLVDLARAHPRCRFVVDESYLAFAGQVPFLAGRTADNVMVLSSMSKIHRIPGLRIGFVAGTAAVISKLAAHRLPWSLNALAQAAVSFLAQHPEAVAAFVDETRGFLEAERRHVCARLSGLSGLRTFDSRTSFILMALSPPATAAAVCAALAERMILVRDASNFIGLGPQYLRLSLKDRAANDRAVDLLDALLSVSVTGGVAP